MGQRGQDDIGEALRRLRHEAGDPTYREIERAVVKILGQHAPGAEAIRLYHHGRVRPDRADVLLVAALADFYQVPISDISDVVAERFEPAKELFDRPLLLIRNNDDETGAAGSTVTSRLSQRRRARPLVAAFA